MFPTVKERPRAAESTVLLLPPLARVLALSSSVLFFARRSELLRFGRRVASTCLPFQPWLRSFRAAGAAEGTNMPWPVSTARVPGVIWCGREDMAVECHHLRALCARRRLQRATDSIGDRMRELMATMGVDGRLEGSVCKEGN
jgi:hypothetical protein